MKLPWIIIASAMSATVACAPSATPSSGPIAVASGSDTLGRSGPMLLPPACQRLNAIARTLPRWPSVNILRRTEQLRPTIRRAIDATLTSDSEALGKARLDTIWQSDSAATELGLAQLTSDEQYATSRESDAAGFQYHQFSGRGGPMIGAMFDGRTPSRRNLALVAIRQLDDSIQQLSVFYFACTALWELNAVGSDSAYQRLSRVTVATTQYDTDAGILTQATRLLSGVEREVVVKGIAEVIPYYQPITIFPSGWGLSPRR